MTVSPQTRYLPWFWPNMASASFARVGRWQKKEPALATLILAIDQGTTSTRAFLFDAGLSPVAFAQCELPQIFPASGHVEHDPAAIWDTSVATARAAMANAGVAASD